MQTFGDRAYINQWVGAFKPANPRSWVSAEEVRIVLVPVRPDRANRVRSKLAELGIEEPDVADAIAWARRE